MTNDQVENLENNILILKTELLEAHKMLNTVASNFITLQQQILEALKVSKSTYKTYVEFTELHSYDVVKGKLHESSDSD